MDFGRCLLISSVVRPGHVSNNPFLIADSHVDVMGLKMVACRKAAWSRLLYGSYNFFAWGVSKGKLL